MPFVHGHVSAVSLGGSDLSVYGASVEWNRKADSHDVTTFGKGSHVKFGGLLDGSATIKGVYDSTVTVGPRAVINPKIGTTALLIWRPEGAGVGKPQDIVNALVTGYAETSPVADMITWQADLDLSDDVVTSTQ